MCSGQVLHVPYSSDKARLVVREMSDLLVLDIVEKGLVTDQIVLTVGYDIENVQNDDIGYDGDITVDRYGRSIPKHAHGTVTLSEYTSSTKIILDEVTKLYDKIVNPKLFIRRINISVNRLIPEHDVIEGAGGEQLDFFSYLEADSTDESKELQKEKERKKQQAMIDIKRKYGKNSILRGMNLEEGATALSRNKQIGGHKA